VAQKGAGLQWKVLFHDWSSGAHGCFQLKGVGARGQVGEVNLAVGLQAGPGFVEALHDVAVFRPFGGGVAERGKIYAEGGLIIGQCDLVCIDDRPFQERAVCIDPQLYIVYLEAGDIYGRGKIAKYKIIG